MDNTVSLLTFWGWLLTVVCSIYIIRPKVCKSVLSMMLDERFVLISGWFSIILGAFTLSFDPPEFGIRLLGAVFLFAGILRVAFPEHFPPIAGWMKRRTYIPLLISLFGLIVGLDFLFNVYFR